MWWCFKKNKTGLENTGISIPENNRQVFAQLAKMMANPHLISKVCQLNYSYIQLSSLELEVLNNLEKRSGQKITGLVYNQLNKPLQNKKIKWLAISV